MINKSIKAYSSKDEDAKPPVYRTKSQDSGVTEMTNVCCRVPVRACGSSELLSRDRASSNNSTTLPHYLFCAIIMIAAAVLFVRLGTGEAADDYLRIGSMNVGAKIYDDSDDQAALARADWIVLDFHGNRQRIGQTMSDVLRRIRQMSPDVFISQYIMLSGAIECTRLYRGASP